MGIFRRAFFNSPAYTQGFSALQNQIISENPGLDTGVLTDKIGGAQDLYNSALEGLISNNFATGALSALGDPIAGAAQAASNFVATGSTVLGAVNTIGGLISVAENGSPAQITQAFSGALIGLATVGVASGVLTAGVGAAICAAIAIVAEVAESLFGTPAPTYKLGECSLSQSPPWAVGFMAPYFSTTVIKPVLGGPSSVEWRKFPVNPLWAGGQYVSDKYWFAPGGQPVNLNGLVSLQKGVKWGTDPDECWILCAAGTPRPIDAAFNGYLTQECDIGAANRVLYNLAIGPNASNPDPALKLTSDDQAWLNRVGTEVAYAMMRLTKAYFAAWCINAEYSLNGLGANIQNGTNAQQTDPQVLVQVVNHWNSAHAPGVGYEIAPPSGKTSSNYLYNVPCSSQTIDNSYIHLLVGDLQATGNTSTLTGGKTLHINTGPLLNPPNTLVGTGATVPGTLLHTPTPSASMSTGGKVATALAVGGGAALVGSAVYAHMTRQSLSSVWRGLYNAARRKI